MQKVSLTLSGSCLFMYIDKYTKTMNSIIVLDQIKYTPTPTNSMLKKIGIDGEKIFIGIFAYFGWGRGCYHSW